MAITRRRGRELEDAISKAVLLELHERGYAAVTYEGVAARASTSKPVLYRRWPTKAEMVMAAIMATTTEAIAVPDTGSLAGDLTALLAAMHVNFGALGRATMLGLLAGLDQHAAESLSSIIVTWGGELVEPLVERARARDELGDVDLPPGVLTLPLDLARHDLAIRGTMSSERIRTIVETIVVPLMTSCSRAS